jgi:hypothetical protein
VKFPRPEINLVFGLFLWDIVTELFLKISPQWGPDLGEEIKLFSPGALILIPIGRFKIAELIVHEQADEAR